MSLDFDDIDPKPLEPIPQPKPKPQPQPQPRLQPIEVPPKPKIQLSFFEKIRAYFFLKTNEGKQFMWETLKKFLVAKIVGWILKIGSGVLLTLGISQGSIEEFIGAAVSFIIGLIISLVVNKKAALTHPSEFYKY